MAFGFDVAALPAYTDQLSLDLISKVVLKTDLLDYIDLRSGFTSGTVAINLVDAALPVSALSCGWTSDGQVTYTQVNVIIESLQSKTEMCVEDLRATYQSAFMNAGTGNDFIPFENVISESYSDKLRKYNEGFLINGSAGGAMTGLKGQITAANGANLQGGAIAAWTAANAFEQALDLYDAIDESVKDRDDLIMVVSPDAYRALVRALVAQNLYHFNSVESNDILILPGTNVTVVKSSGLVGSDNKFAGPGKMILAATGLTDELDNFRFFYDEAADVMKFRAAWRLGVGVGEVNVFATNDMA
jgi:hypothetical protein|tara:strand:- start:148 stop:1053 length:906 start_codon:yes stop_codon:yes gene_type:complete